MARGKASHASSTRGTAIAVVAAALILLVPAIAAASQCSRSERVDREDAECLSASWRNRGIFKKSTYRVRNMCTAYGRVAAKVDLVAAKDRTVNLDDGRPRRGWAWRQIRSISCCSDIGICNRSDAVTDGPTLAVKTDALIVRAASDAVSGPGGKLAAAEAEVTRLRLEGSRPFRLADGSTLTPGMEIAMRHDGGDAETGFGADIGAALAWTVPRYGLRMELRGRGLVAHESKGFREYGISGSFAWKPAAGERGPRLSVARTLGIAARGGTDALLERTTLSGWATNDNGRELRPLRLEARLGYGFAAFGGRFTSTPETAVGLSDTGRDYSLGWRLARDRGADGRVLELALELRRQETAGGRRTSPEHAVGVRVTSRF